MPTIHTIARSIRHAPGLESLNLLWRVARVPYYAIAKRRGGVTMEFGGERVLIPVEFADQGWDVYEPDAMHAFVQWVRAHPTGTFIDVGCSVGLYAHVALCISKSLNVVAIDADIASIAVMRRLTEHVHAGRLLELCCLVGESSESGGMGLAECNSETHRRLAAGDGNRTPRYTCLDTTEAVPIYKLDTFRPADSSKPLLVKVDVEGAELAALKGAERLLEFPDISLLLSVHSNLMWQYGHTREMLEAFLLRHGFQSTMLAVDHEEHWWVSRADTLRDVGAPSR